MSDSHGLKVGDPVLWPLRLTRWERFKLWIRNPFRRPAETEPRTYYVTSVTEGSSFQISETKD